jgi:ABC-type nitrate/sulfonate/bicarbonate transport system permease component
MKYNRLLGLIALPLIWEVFCRLYNNYYFPTLDKIFVDSFNSIPLQIVFQNLGLTVFSTLLCFIFGNVLGFIGGIIFSYNQLLGQVSKFTIDFMRSLPSIAVFPLFMVLFGINLTTKIAVAVFGIFWVVIFAIVQSVRSLSEVKMQYLKVHGANHWDLFSHYIIYVLFENWLTLFKITLSLSLFITISLEMFIGSEHGLGKAIIDSKSYYEINQMYFWIILTGLVGYLLNKIISSIQARFLRLV